VSKRFSPKFKAEALRLLSVGVTTREAQAQLKRRFREHVGEGTLRAWAKAADAAPPASEGPPPPTAPAPPATVAPAPQDVYEHTRTQLATSIQRAEEASAIGNYTAAQRFSKQIVDYTLLLARLDKERRSDTDVVTIPRAELERARAAMHDRVSKLKDDLARTGGLVCSNCGREIRLALARGDN
jgi:hypothetical protein